MSLLLLDTPVLIDLLRGRQHVGQRLTSLAARSSVPVICAVNVEEVWRGARPGDEGRIERLLRGLRTVPLGHGEGEQAGRWRREFAARGVTLTQGDCLVAAAAVSAGARLATANVRDFPMRGLVVEDWSP